MAEYIDREVLLKKNWYGNTNSIVWRTYASELIKSAPAADVVEVVRCKDCKKWSKYENTAGAGYCLNKKFCFTYGARLERKFTPITMPNDFCSYGERNEQK